MIVQKRKMDSSYKLGASDESKVTPADESENSIARIDASNNSVAPEKRGRLERPTPDVGAEARHVSSQS